MSSEVTVLLEKIRHGDDEAANDLFRAVEEQLRAIAAKRRAGFAPGMDAPVTLLVNEAFLRVLGADAAPIDRLEFFKFAAVKVQDLLIEIARRESAKKRGGDREGTPVPADGVAAGSPEHSNLLTDLRDSLDRFERFAPEEATVFRFRYFLDCSFEETAEILGLSSDQAKRRYKRAKMWLQKDLKDYTGA